MTKTSGAGRVIRDLGLIDRFDDDINGVIGGRGQPSTLLVVFRTNSPFMVSVLRQAVQPFTDRFLAVGLRRQDGGSVSLDETGRPIPPNAFAADDAAQGRLPPGEYAITIATSQWQQAPFRVRLALTAIGSLRAVMASRAALAGGFRIARLSAQLGGFGELLLKPSRLQNLPWITVQRGRLWCGLTSVPTYQADTRAGLPHAWLTESDLELSVGCGDGSAWLTTAWPAVGDYIPSGVSLADYRGGTERLIFAEGAESVYAAYADIGPEPTDVSQAISPDVPSRAFQSVIQGRHIRRCTFSLPVDGATQLVVVIREELRWNNDVIRDVETVGSALPRYTAQNVRPVSAHQRTIWVFTVTSTQVRRLRQPPIELRSKLDAVLPPLTSTLRLRRLQVPGTRYTPASVDCLAPDFALTGAAPNEGDRIFGADPTEPYGNLLISFGLTWAMQARRGFTSAAVYDFLFNASTILSAPDYDRRSYAFAIRVLTSRPDGLTQYSPWLTEGGYALGGAAESAYQSAVVARLLYGTWAGPFPADASTQQTLSGPRWRLSSISQDLTQSRSNTSAPLQVLVAYDWGQPSYCRARLGVLGFTAADLLSRETSWRALLSLNPSGSGPCVGTASLSASRLVAQTTRRLGLALSATAGLMGSRVGRGDFKILAGRGRLGLQLGVTPGAAYVALASWQQGRGVLAAGTLRPRLFTRLTGQHGPGRPTLIAAKIIVSTPAAFVCSGSSAQLSRDRRLVGQVGILETTGAGAELRLSDYALTGQSATLGTTGQAAEIALLPAVVQLGLFPIDPLFLFPD